MHNTIISDRILDKYIGHGNWKIHDVYKNMRFFLKAAHLHRTAKILDDNHLLHCALREERCHWAFCKLLINLRPEQVLSRDLDGNLPLHIIVASKDLSDKGTFVCFTGCRGKNKLFNIEFVAGGSKSCCEDCLKNEPDELIRESFEINPGASHNIFVFDESSFSKVSFIL